jgi:benzoyl-CoA reductase/2-hydroxyglutaryl-CoA dehydratase subunit BcrC/BadD/HgdB
MDQVEQYLPRNTCALIKSAFGFKLGEVCPYLEATDLVVGENTCDGKKKAFESLGGLIDNLYVMDLPQVKSDQGRSLLKAEYIRFKDQLEELTGVTITVEKLAASIAIVNAKRGALHRLAKLRSADPSPISGMDALLANQISFFDDPVRFTESLNKICDELEQRITDKIGVFPAKTPRILISGCPMAIPNWKLPTLIESCGGVIVGEESCIGERGCRNLVPNDAETLDELLDGIVERYFKVDCAVFTPNHERVDHIDEMFRNLNADGVIHYGLQFCQPYLMEAMNVEKKLENADIPVLRVETDYGTEDVGQLKTRVEAFVEQLRA